MLLIILAILVLCIVLASFKVYGSKVSGSTHEVMLRVTGENLIGGVDWSGNHTSPVTYDFGYHDITNLPNNIFETNLTYQIGSTLNDLMAYANSHPDNQVFVQLSKADGSEWYVPTLVTNDKSKLTSDIFMKGKLDGGGVGTALGNHDLWSAASVIYSGIQSSQDLVPFTDFFSIAPAPPAPDNVTAKILVDSNGNSALKEILVHGKTCITKGNIDLSDTTCWNNRSSANQAKKKYSLTFLPLLFRKLSGR